MKNKKKNQIKMLLSAFAVIGAMALFPGSASAMMVIDRGVIPGTDIPIDFSPPPPPPPALEGIGEDVAGEAEAGESMDWVAGFDSSCRVKCGEYVPPPKNPFVEGDFSDALIPPARDGGFGVPTPRRVDNVNTPVGVVDMVDRVDRAQDKGEGVSIPGIPDITFAVDNGDGQITGAEVLDLAIGTDRFQEAAGKFNVEGDTIGLCY